MVEFCKNQKFARQSLQSIELFRQSISKMNELTSTNQVVSPRLISKVSENLTDMMHQGILSMQTLSLVPASTTSTTASNTTTKTVPTTVQIKPIEEETNMRFWFPILFGLYEIIMVCELEVRSRALVYLFDTLKSHGKDFSKDFWAMVAKGVLFPIFDDLRLSRQEHTKFANKEDMSVWMSTTLIQALRLLIDLFSTYFDELKFLYGDILEILEICMTQENETLSRIGSTCLQEMIECNLYKLQDEEFELLCGSLVYLLQVTTPTALFFDLNNEEDSPLSDAHSSPLSDAHSSPLSDTHQQNSTSHPSDTHQQNSTNSINKSNPKVRVRGPQPKPSEFQKIIVKCVLHLLIIQTIQEILISCNGNLVKRIDSKHLLSLSDAIYSSFKFAEEFNLDLELRNALLRIGFMKQLPNLLKQETSSMSLYIWLLSQMYSDENRIQDKHQIEERFIQ